MNKLNQFFLENPETFRKVILTDFSISIFNLVVKHQPNATVANMVKDNGMRVCTLNSHLKSLCEKGYLTRKMVRGRINAGEYLYSVK